MNASRTWGVKTLPLLVLALALSAPLASAAGLSLAASDRAEVVRFMLTTSVLERAERVLDEVLAHGPDAVTGWMASRRAVGGGADASWTLDELAAALERDDMWREALRRQRLPAREYWCFVLGATAAGFAVGLERDGTAFQGSKLRDENLRFVRAHRERVGQLLDGGGGAP